jgi:hypothetical protein
VSHTNDQLLFVIQFEWPFEKPGNMFATFFLAIECDKVFFVFSLYGYFSFHGFINFFESWFREYFVENSIGVKKGAGFVRPVGKKHSDCTSINTT